MKYFYLNRIIIDVTIVLFVAAAIAILTSDDINHAENTMESKNERQEEKPSKFKKITAKITAYCPCEKCCGEYSDGVTSTGPDAYTRGCAVDPRRIPYGSIIQIDGYGTVTADDTGGAMRNSDIYHIDVRFATHQEALNFGVKKEEVLVYYKE